MAAQMNRRDWMKLFAAGVAGAMVMDPEKLLWVPGEKTIFLPPVVSLREAETELIHSIWQLTLRLKDLDRLHQHHEAVLHHVGTKEQCLDVQRQIVQERNRCFGTVAIAGKQEFQAEWHEVSRTSDTVTFQNLNHLKRITNG